MDTDIIGTCSYITFHKYDVEHDSNKALFVIGIALILHYLMFDGKQYCTVHVLEPMMMYSGIRFESDVGHFIVCFDLGKVTLL